jgi:hypothetical protein
MCDAVSKDIPIPRREGSLEVLYLLHLGKPYDLQALQIEQVGGFLSRKISMLITFVLW